MAPPARLELTTLRLGGVRSIQVSYGGVCKDYCSLNEAKCQPKSPVNFSPSAAYNVRSVFKGGQENGTGCGRLHF